MRPGRPVWVEPSIYAPHHRERIGPLTRSSKSFSTRRARPRGSGSAWASWYAADRTVDPADAIEQAELAVRFRDQGVVSFGLANDEAIGPPRMVR